MLYDLRIKETTPLISANQMAIELPMTDAAAETVEAARQAFRRIMYRQDHRLVLIVGPCSIHDIEAAMDYAKRLAPLIKRFGDRLVIIMRVYFEKPRTRKGWRGLIVDPHMDGSNDGQEGLRQARSLLLEINSLGVPTCSELIDPVTPQYIGDLLSVAAIGARSTESPLARALASGLSMPPGFKNGTSGNIEMAVDAMIATQDSNSLFGPDRDGRSAVHHTSGNPDTFMILRGGKNGPNYSPKSVRSASSLLRKENLIDLVMIDCSHAQSGGDPVRQEAVWREVVDSLPGTREYVMGLMVESFIEAGKQPIQLPVDRTKLKYGLSVTDACMDWSTTEQMIEYTYEQLSS
ncbi:3-deoxy-7-phosphoheptulonate synthase [Candidatus Saccharibacteria bacterium]|nr:3-deoxy-7-phosphoheptulonate synthase [Candidatus Saccharibacteria bacterium]